jgi:hypothetical protein
MPTPAEPTTLNGTPDEQRIRREIDVEREELARTLDELREEANLTRKLRGKVPVVVVGGLGAGFVLGGGIGATMRLLMRRGREGTEKARLGRFRVAQKD